MTKIRVATLSAFLVAFSGFAAQAQNTSYGTGACNTGTNNSAFGYDALYHCSSSSNNDTAVGAGALESNTTGTANTAVGTGVLYDTTTGSDNTAIGEATLSYKESLHKFCVPGLID